MAERWQQWMPFHIDRWRGSPSVQAMHPAAQMGYLNLLCSCWQSPDCCLPNDPVDLATESRLGDELWALYGPRILRKFVLIDGRWRNEVLFAAWIEAKRVYEKRKSGAVRTNSSRSADAQRSQSSRPADTVTGTVTGTKDKDMSPPAPADASHPLVLSGPEGESSAKVLSMPPGGAVSVDTVDLRAMVQRVFEHYVRRMGRDPTRYDLTKQRLEQGIRRAAERVRKRGGDAAAAEADLADAVDALAGSAWHREHGHTGWEQIFRSEDKFQTILNFASPARQASRPKSALEKFRESA